jgi:hypothetical protein
MARDRRPLTSRDQLLAQQSAQTENSRAEELQAGKLVRRCSTHADHERSIPGRMASNAITASFFKVLRPQEGRM